MSKCKYIVGVVVCGAWIKRPPMTKKQAKEYIQDMQRYFNYKCTLEYKKRNGEKVFVFYNNSTDSRV